MKLCFTTIAYDWYQDLIPIYILSILKAFPQHYVKLFSEDNLTDYNQSCLSLIRKQVSDNFEVVENFRDLDSCKISHKAANRFLLTREYFEGFDYVYIGDIDFIIYNQFDDQFFDHYVSRCENTGFPFSNSYWVDKGRFRMTGLHFIIKDKYFDILDEEISKMKCSNEFRINYKTNPYGESFDEEMLYFMLEQKFNLKIIEGYIRPLHGVHLGVFRHDLNFCITNPNWKHQSQCIEDLKKIDPVFKSDVFHECYKTMRPEAKHILKNTIFMLYKKFYL